MPILQVDSDAIHRAVLNVVTNAIDACEGRPEGKVAIATKYLEDDALAQITIQDNGVGISAEQLPKIFQAFVSDKGSRGTGLGLPVSQKIVKEHGGRILVDSQIGRGSRFTLEIPAVLANAVRETNVGGAVDYSES
jgi:signal transduction histidine kinase